MTNRKILSQIKDGQLALDRAQRQVFLQSTRTDAKLSDLLRDGNQELAASYYAAAKWLEELHAQRRASGV